MAVQRSGGSSASRVATMATSSANGHFPRSAGRRGPKPQRPAGSRSAVGALLGRPLALLR
eukprot:182642-Alexandrium_andersonii.AAC.1